MAAIGQELLNVPMGDMIRQMALSIAEAQYQLDENSINVAEMMGGLTTVYDEKDQVSFDDSRVFFGYDYMTMKEARAFAALDDGLSGGVGEGTVKLDAILDNIEASYKKNNGKDIPETEEIRVPTRVSMMELGFTPTFYQFVDTIIEVKIAIKITRTKEYSVTRKKTENDTTKSYKRKRSFWGSSSKSSRNTNVTTTQVDATYSGKYSYSAEGASLLRTKLTPVPPPAVLEERIRDLMEHEAARREASLNQDAENS